MTVPGDKMKEQRLDSQIRALRNLARSLVAQGDAEDLVQDACVVALQTGEDHCGSWFARVLRNRALFRARSARHRRLREASVAKPEASVPSAGDLVEELELQRALVEAIAGLRETYQQVVMLRYWHNLPPREISVRIGEPVQTVKTRLKRALAQLRGKLDGTCGGRAAWVPVVTRFFDNASSPFPSASIPGATVLTTVASLMKTKFLLSALVIIVLAIGFAFFSLPHDLSVAKLAKTVTETAANTVADSMVEAQAHDLREDANTVQSELERTAISHQGISGIAVVARNSNGVPVPNLRVTFHLLSSPFVQERPRPQITDSLGYAVCKDVYGTIRIVMAGQEDLRVTIDKVEYREVDVVVPGPSLTWIKVVDDKGKPVPFADVIQFKVYSDATHELGVTGLDGRLAVAGLTKQDHVVARAAGFFPSATVRLAMETRGEPLDEEEEIVIPLRAGGCVLRGRVVDEGGAGIAGATVQARSRSHRGAAPPPIETDADGSFSISGLPSGAFQLLTSKDRFVPASDHLLFAEGQRSLEQTTVLEQGVAIYGRVTNHAGVSIAGATVRIRFDTSTERHDRLAAIEVVTDASGLYRIEAAPLRKMHQPFNTAAKAIGKPGAVEVQSVAIWCTSDRHGSAATVLSLEPGQPEHTWDPILTVDKILTVQLVDELDDPVVGVSVRCTGSFRLPGTFSPSQDHLVGRTNTDGIITWRNAQAINYRLSVKINALGWGGFSSGRFVSTSKVTNRLRLPTLASGKATIEFISPDEADMLSVTLVHPETGLSFFQRVFRKRGTLIWSRLPIGSWQVEVNDGQARVLGTRVALISGDHLELFCGGDKSGSVVVQLRGASSGAVVARVMTKDGSHVEFGRDSRKANQITLRELDPANYIVWLMGPPWVHYHEQMFPVTVRAGSETTIVYEAQRARSVTLKVRFAGHSGATKLLLELLHADGRSLVKREIQLAKGEGQLLLGLAPGDYRIRRAGDRVHEDSAFQIPEDGGFYAPIELSVRVQ